jgi:hypothetical protein
MKIKVMLLAELITIFQPVNAEEDISDFGKELAICSAKFETTSEIFRKIGDEKLSEKLKDKSHGFLIASVASYLTDGVSRKVASSATKGDLAIALSKLTLNYESIVKSGDQEQFKEFLNVLLSDIEKCAAYNNYVDKSIKIMKKSL